VSADLSFVGILIIIVAPSSPFSTPCSLSLFLGVLAHALGCAREHGAVRAGLGNKDKVLSSHRHSPPSLSLSLSFRVFPKGKQTRSLSSL